MKRNLGHALALGGFSAAIGALYLLSTSPSLKKRDMSSLKCDFAHRGMWDSQTPENSMTAFRRACDAGVGIELDVRLTKDGHAVVFHDRYLNRMCGVDAELSSLTYAEISSLRLSNTGEGIPLLSDVLDMICGSVPLMIELKGEDLNTGVCAETARLLDKYEGSFCIESFNPALTYWFRVNRPSFIRGQLLIPYKYAGESGHAFLNVFMSSLIVNSISRPDFISMDKRFKHNVGIFSSLVLWKTQHYVWTVTDTQELELMHKNGKSVIFEGIYGH